MVVVAFVVNGATVVVDGAIASVVDGADAVAADLAESDFMASRNRGSGTICIRAAAPKVCKFLYNSRMAEMLLRTRLFVPALRPDLVRRSRLIDKLNQGLKLGHKLTLISAPAGFDKSTLVSAWIAGSNERPAAWLLLDEGDNDLTRFVTYLIAALRDLAA